MQFTQLNNVASWVQLQNILFSDPYLTPLLLTIAILAICSCLYLLSKSNKRIKDVFILAGTLINITYLGWRIGFTLATISLISFVLSLVLVLAELMGFSKSLTYRILFTTPAKLKPAVFSNLGYVPTVDVLITTYTEPAAVIHRTIAGATQLNYPQDKLTIYVCDDGSRDEIKQICDDYHVHWITRQEHLDAKAGNLNHCYRNYAKSEFSVVLDADMVPKSDFLEKTLGYFKDEMVAFVQTPQVFYNSDSFQRNLGLNDNISNEQDFFMQEIQAHRQEYNALIFVGSGCVFRRTHLEKIGFIPTGSITEDLATSLLLQREGFKGRFTKNTFALGLSAESFTDYIKQRTRWAQGNIEILKKWNPWKMKTLSFMQKVIISDGILYWFYGVEKMIFILAPMVYILLGIPIMLTNPINLLFFWLPSFYINRLIVSAFSHASRTSGWTHIYETASAPHLAVAALRALLFNKEKRFIVTPKGHTQSRSEFALSVAKPHLILFVLSLLSLGVVVFKVATAANISSIIIYVLNGAWILYNFFAIIASLIICFEKPRIRKYDRLTMDIDIPIIIDGQSGFTGKLNNMSEGGCSISPDNLPNPKDFIGSEILLLTGEVIITGTILNYSSRKKAFAVEFDDISESNYAKFVKFVFSNQTTGFGSLKERHPFTAVVSKFLRGILVTMIRRVRNKKRRNKALILTSHTNDHSRKIK